MPRQATETARMGLGAPLFALLLLLSGCDSTLEDTPAGVLGQVLTSNAVAADAQAGRPGLAERVARLTDRLTLSSEQTEAIEEVVGRYESDTPEAGVLWYVAADVQKILTSEQLDELEEALDTRRTQRRAAVEERPGPRAFGGQRGFGTGRTTRAGGPLRARGAMLTDEQREAMAALMEEMRPQLQALREARQDGTLTPEEAREQAQEIHNNLREQVEALLTDEQRAALEARRGTFEARREDGRQAMMDALELTPEQQAALDALHTSRNAGDFDPEAHLQARADLFTEAQLEIMTVHQTLASGRQRPGRAGNRPFRMR